MSHDFSYSQLSTAYKCNMLFKHLYVDRLKPPGNESGDMKFGTGIHLAINTVLAKDGDPQANFDMFWDLQKTGNDFGRFKWEELRDMAHVFISRFERLHAKKFEPFQMEERLHGRLGDIEISGTPDFIGKYNGIPSIVDFKTAGSRYNPEKATIAEQLFLYAHLARETVGFIAKQVVFIVFVKGPNPSIQSITAPISQVMLNTVVDNIKLQCEELEVKIESGKFTKNLNGCGMGGMPCQFKERCFPND